VLLLLLLPREVVVAIVDVSISVSLAPVEAKVVWVLVCRLISML